MQALPLHPSLPSASSAIATSSPGFVETAEYSRFVEFSDACREYRYISLCFGPPGVGKSLSALRYSRNDRIVPLGRWTAEAQDQQPIDTVLYTPDVVNSPSGVDFGIRRAREVLSSISTRAVRSEARATLDRLKAR